MQKESDLTLHDGGRVAVMGGGPAGTFFAYFLLDMAQRVGLDLRVDIYEPRDFTRAGPPGCNMCGGVISESLVQLLAAEGINLPPAVVQRGISAYVLHTNEGDVRIATPQSEKRIGTVYRGPGPLGLKEAKWGSFDGHLMSLAVQRGAHVIRTRVSDVSREDGRLAVKTRVGTTAVYDLLAVTAGVNTAAYKHFDGLGLEYRPPRTTKTFIREYYLGEEVVERYLGSALHVFLLNLPRLEFAMIVPKGDYATLVLLGDEIDDGLVQAFVNSPEVKNLMPPDLRLDWGPCQCQPRLTTVGAAHPFGDRVVFIGDCAVTRLYKDGIGAAYRAAKAAATTSVFQGISAADFRRYYLPACQTLETDNAFGKIIFFVTRLIQRASFAHRAVLRMTAYEQQEPGRRRRMSTVLWDTFTGSAPYRDIFWRTLYPAFWLRFGWDILVSLVQFRPRPAHGRASSPRDLPPDPQIDKEKPMDTGTLGRTYEPGEVIIRQGDVGDRMYVILEGKVEVYLERDGKEVPLRLCHPGDFLGEMALFHQQVNSANARALDQVRTLTLNKNSFLRRIQEDPTLAFRLVETLSHRVGDLDEEVAVLSRVVQECLEEQLRK